MANKISYEGFQPDSIVQSINEKLVGRAEVGFNKYGATMDRDDLSEGPEGVELLQSTFDMDTGEYVSSKQKRRNQQQKKPAFRQSRRRRLFLKRKRLSCHPRAALRRRRSSPKLSGASYKTSSEQLRQL